MQYELKNPAIQLNFCRIQAHMLTLFEFISPGYLFRITPDSKSTWMHWISTAHRRTVSRCCLTLHQSSAKYRISK